MRCMVCSDIKSKLYHVNQFAFPYESCAVCIASGLIPYHVLCDMVYANGGVINAGHVNMAIALGYSSAEFESDCANYTDKRRGDLN